MQLYALEEKKQTIHAVQAKKHTDYLCIECGQTVRLRRGSHRQPHFYHLLPNHKCRLNGKSMPHLMLQKYLESILPRGEVQLEHRFPAIKRIADVAWITQKLIFEIQCSPISAAEVRQRNADYASQGYRVIWILHQSRYNQQRVTAAEDALKNLPHYFSDMNSQGKGIIYDQLSCIVEGMRKQWLPKLIADMTHPHHDYALEETEVALSHFPEIILHRLHNYPLHFTGDYVHTSLHHASNAALFDAFAAEIKDAESKWLHPDNDNIFELSLWNSIKALLLQWIALPYRSLLRLLLERASR